MVQTLQKGNNKWIMTHTSVVILGYSTVDKICCLFLYSSLKLLCIHYSCFILSSQSTMSPKIKYSICCLFTSNPLATTTPIPYLLFVTPSNPHPLSPAHPFYFLLFTFPSLVARQQTIPIALYIACVCHILTWHSKWHKDLFTRVRMDNSLREREGGRKGRRAEGREGGKWGREYGRKGGMEGGMRERGKKGVEEGMVDNRKWLQVPCSETEHWLTNQIAETKSYSPVLFQPQTKHWNKTLYS